ncbi:hypothetical protein KCP73_16105 [Salmonella enterica subsp. enterica]|nr:hypothetical protein KCP73_16105 [Salmonella enterica subsp. enterica]
MIARRWKSPNWISGLRVSSRTRNTLTSSFKCNNLFVQRLRRQQTLPQGGEFCCVAASIGYRAVNLRNTVSLLTAGLPNLS